MVRQGAGTQSDMSTDSDDGLDPGGPDLAPLALVTGASSGIGRALAGRLAEKGYDLVVAAVDDAVRETAVALAETGAQVWPVQVDLATEAGVRSLYDEVTAVGRPVDVAALNAGVVVGGEFAGSDLDAHLRLVDLNCRSVVQLAMYLVRDLTRVGRGRMLFVSSEAAVAPGPYQSTYSASKAFVHSFAMALRHELRDSGVSVTVLMPGPTDTEIFERGGMTDTQLAQGRKDDPEDVAEDALEGLLAGRDQVVTGPWRTHLQVAAGRLVPDSIGAAVSAQLSKPGSGDRPAQTSEKEQG